MSSIASESIDVDSSQPDVVRVSYTRVMSDGIDMGGKLVFSRSTLPWLLGELSKAARDDNYERVIQDVGVDKLRVYVSGHEMSPYVNVINQRAEDAPQGGLSGVVMTQNYASKLVELLRKL